MVSARLFAMTALLLLLLASCSVVTSTLNIFNDSAFRTVEMPDGQRMMADTRDGRAMAFAVFDNDIAHEAKGSRPPGGLKTWNERWVGSVRSLRQEMQNGEDYVRYIVERRRAAGLPELKGI